MTSGYMDNVSVTQQPTSTYDDDGLFGGALCSVPLKPSDRPNHLEILAPPAVMLFILISSKIRGRFQK